MTSSRANATTPSSRCLSLLSPLLPLPPHRHTRAREAPAAPYPPRGPALLPPSASLRSSRPASLPPPGRCATSHAPFARTSTARCWRRCSGGRPPSAWPAAGSRACCAARGAARAIGLRRSHRGWASGRRGWAQGCTRGLGGCVASGARTRCEKETLRSPRTNECNESTKQPHPPRPRSLALSRLSSTVSTLVQTQSLAARGGGPTSHLVVVPCRRGSKGTAIINFKERGRTGRERDKHQFITQFIPAHAFLASRPRCSQSPPRRRRTAASRETAPS